MRYVARKWFAEPPLARRLYLRQFALLRGQVAEDQPQQTSHHYHHPQWVLMLKVLRGQWKGVLCCKSPRFAPGSIHYGHAESLSSFPKEQHVKVPRVGKYFVSFLFVCLSSMFLRRREGERDLNLKRGIQLWVSLKRHLVFFLMGEWC